MTDLRRRVAVVTGGGRGIGQGITLARAGAGLDVVVGYHRDRDAAEKTAAAARERGAAAEVVAGDVAADGTADALVAAAAGLGGLDVWVNNAGVLHAAPLLDTSVDDAEAAMRTNYLGTFRGLSAAAAAMVAAGGGGRIVNISSEVGLRAWPLYAAYAPTKFAIIGLTQVAALELGAHGILVNAVCPGLVETDMVTAKWPLEAALTGTTVEAIRAASAANTPTGRLVTPAEVGGVVAWLAGDQAAGVTGQAVCVNGGATLH